MRKCKKRARKDASLEVYQLSSLDLKLNLQLYSMKVVTLSKAENMPVSNMDVSRFHAANTQLLDKALF